MKKKFNIVILSIFFLSFNLLYSSDAQLEDISSNEQIFHCVESDLYTTSLQFSLPDFEIQYLQKKSEEYAHITLQNEGALMHEGLPEVPTVSRLVAIPNSGSVNVEIISLEDDIIKNIQIYPYQREDRASDKFFKDEEFYMNSTPFPEQIFSVSEPQIFRDIRLVNVTINPFRFYPDKQELRIIKNAQVIISATSHQASNEKAQKPKISRYFEPMYQAMISNYEEVFTEVEYQDPCYLFICPNDNTVKNYLSYLTSWKHQKGFHVEVADLAHTGTSSSQIKTYIQNAYNTWQYPPDFICLVGDADGSYSIPTGYYSSGEGDQYYSLLEGNDILADVIIGRLSFNTLLEFQTIIAKILNYEKTPYMANTDWYKKALLVGDPSTSGPSCVATCKFVKEIIRSSTHTYAFDEVYSNPFVSGISNSINSGVSYFHYRGYYGMSGWDNTDISNLNNGFLLPFAIFPTCGTGNFQGTTGRSEYFLKAGTPSTSKGAIAAIGTATLNTHTSFNNCISAGIFNGIFRDNIYNPGGALVRSKLSLYRSYPTNPNNWVNCFSYWNNLMGDPGMELWTDVPIEFNVTHPINVPIGSKNIEVVVKNTYSFAIEDAWVTIVQGDDAIFESGYTDKSGKIILPFDTSVIEDVTITVTKHNHIPYISTISISQAENFASISQMTIDDDNSGSSFGNNNGMINPGEDIELVISLKNYGNNALHDVTATLTTDDAGVTITDSTENFGVILVDQEVQCNDAFDFSVEADVLGGSELTFELIIHDSASDEWIDRFTLPIYGANIDFIEYAIFDGNNGVLDPGETAELLITLYNAGSVRADNIYGALSSNDDTIIISDSIGFWEAIDPESNATNNSNTFVIFADTQVIPGSQFQFPLHLTNADGFNDLLYVSLVVGEVTEGDPLGPDEYGYYCYDHGDTDYSIAPIYSWIEIDPDYGGNGVILNLNDSGDDGDIVVIDLPFSMSFYGVFYHDLTVCTNGWIAPGVTEDFSFMNRPLPESLGPSPMIAAFWDDLKTSYSSNICYYYDPNSHYFIIEWSHMQNDYNNAEETFQIIIYDPIYYQTPTGDSEILMQYKVFNNVNAGYYSGYNFQHGEYATIGLENSTGKIGLEYTFCNSYPTTARTLTDQSAILFTTRGSQILEPPVAIVSPLEFTFELDQGQNGSDILTISNTGESNLIYSIDKDYVTDRDGGGPDSYGYVWLDSNDPEGPTYDWIDISSIGTHVSFSHNDVASGPFNLEFNFTYYGENYNQFIISPNGWIGFGDDWDDYHNYSIPRIDAPKPAIFGLWDDLDPLQGGDVYYYTNGSDSLIVWFDEVIHYPGSQNGTYDFQMIITDDNAIKFQYRSVSGDINSCTVGIQNENGTVGLEVIYNDYYLQNNLAIEFYRVIDWLNVDPSSGIVFADDTQDIEINVDTGELEDGQIYECDLTLTTNDPNQSQFIIPVNLVVGNVELGTLQGWVTLLGGTSTFDQVTIEINNLTIFPNANGWFEATIPVGNYTFVASCPGYDDYIEDIEILLDQTTQVDPILEYIVAPANIWTTVSEDYNVIVGWNSVSQGTKLFQSYTLTRQVNGGLWITLQEGLSDTMYIDNLYNEPDGEYKYGVKAVYEYTQSGLTTSAVIPIHRFVDVQFEFILSDGSLPIGIECSVTGLDTIYTQVFEDTTIINGTLSYTNVFIADYHIIAQKNGYELVDEIITIDDENTNFEYVLQYITAMGDEPIPLVSKIEQNFPNPFHLNSMKTATTHISYHVTKPAHICIEIYNIKGEKINVLVDEQKIPGIYTTTWNGQNDTNKPMSSGIYFYRMLINGSPFQTKKCVLIR